MLGGVCGHGPVQSSSLSSSGVSSCYSGMDLDRYEGEQSDDEDAFISFTTTESKCEQLYEQGLQYKYRGDLDESLSSFLKCLAGMQECQYFSKLPQTLHQLSELYQSLQLLDIAETYSKAEKLFYEALVTESQATKNGQARQKTKRRPFSKKPRPASSSAAYNPAEYGSILKKKAEMFERLARTCAAECKFDLAQEYSAKAASIRQTVLGQSCRASSDYILYSRAAIHSDGMLKGDLSTAGHVSTVTENETNGGTFCGSTGVSLSHTSGNNGPLYPPLYSSPCLQTENTFTDGSQVAAISFRGAEMRGSCEATTNSNTVDQVEQILPGGFTMTVCQESDGIQRDPEMAGIKGNTHKGMENQQHHNFSAGVTANLNKPMFKLAEFKNPMCKLSELRNPMCNLSNPMSKLSELKKPMSKLSELKNPMCVNLDLHKGPGEEGTESTRCLPLWILLLPALLALVGYVMYYH